MCIRWGDAYSAKFKVTNGVRQGGILSPYLFNVYVDELSEELNKCNVGCNLNGLLINHIMYADDLVLISPSSAGLSQILRECEKFGTRHDVKYNAKKSAVMIYRSMTLKGCTIPNFNLNGMILHVVASYKYLGHYITDDLSDDDDINIQRRTLFVQGTIILRKFNMCSLVVKLTLFRTYCSPMYTAQLWWNYKKSTITKLQIAYHNIFKMFLGMSKYESTSYLCTLFDIQCCQSVIRKLVYGFMCRLDSSVNCIIKGILATSLRYTSRIRKHWCSLLYINSWQINLCFPHCVQLACNVDDIFLLLINIYGPQNVMYYLYAYYTVESGIKQLNWIEYKAKRSQNSKKYTAKRGLSEEGPRKGRRRRKVERKCEQNREMEENKNSSRSAVW